MGYLDEDGLWQVIEEQKRSDGELIGKVAVRLGRVNEDQVLKALGEQLGMKVVKLADLTVPAEIIDLVNETMAQSFKVVPIAQARRTSRHHGRHGRAAKPFDARQPADVPGGRGQGGDRLREGSPGEDRAGLRGQGRSRSRASSTRSSRTRDSPAFAGRNENTIDLEAIEEMAEAAPVRKLLNMVLLLAIKDKASDIHFEPFEDEYKMRYRVDGVLYELVPPPRHLAPAIASRIKVMSNLDIAERRLPQDGRIQLGIGGNQVDIRVSTLPTLFGESVVLRILDRTVVNLDLNKIGMPETRADGLEAGDLPAQRRHPGDRVRPRRARRRRSTPR